LSDINPTPENSLKPRRFYNLLKSPRKLTPIKNNPNWYKNLLTIIIPLGIKQLNQRRPTHRKTLHHNRAQVATGNGRPGRKPQQQNRT
jgi:hypothetical protein